MKIGVPKEIKIHEYRVGMVPAGALELVRAGHQVLVETGAGSGIGFEDAHYRAAGATIAASAMINRFIAVSLLFRPRQLLCTRHAAQCFRYRGESNAVVIT